MDNNSNSSKEESIKKDNGTINAISTNSPISKPGRKKKVTLNKEQHSEKSVLEQIQDIENEWKVERVRKMEEVENKIKNISIYLESIRNDETKIDQYISLTNIKQNLTSELQDLID